VFDLCSQLKRMEMSRKMSSHRIVEGRSSGSFVRCGPVTEPPTTPGRARPWRRFGWIVVVACLLAAIVITLVATSDDRDANDGPRLNTGMAGTTGDHWHAAFGIYQCDRFLNDPIIRPADWPDPTGIHSHNDGMIHIHPFIASVAGENARLGVFFETMGLGFTDQTVELTNGTTLRTGDRCADRPATLKVARYEIDHPEQKPTIITSDLPGIRLRDREALTIALVADGVDVPAPPSATQFDQLVDVGLLPLITRTTR
jgi:hypothetical protein